MTALSAGHPALRARLSEDLGSLLLNTSAREVGRWIGRKGDTVTERGDDPDAWPLSELVILAGHDRDVERSLRAYTQGETVTQGEAVACVGALVAEIGQGARIAQAAAAALTDGKVTREEAMDLLSAIQDRRAEEDRVLIPSLTAVAR